MSDIKKRSWKVWLFLLLFAAFTAALFQEPVQKWVHDFTYTEAAVKVIRVEDGRGLPVAIKDNLAYYRQNEKAPQAERKYIQDFQALKDSVAENKGFRIIEEADSKYGFGYFESYTAEAEITFLLPVQKETVLTFFSGEACSVVQIEVEGSTKYTEPTMLYNPEAEGSLGETRVYPFEHHDFTGTYVCYILCYGGITALFFLLYSLLYFGLSHTQKRNRLLFGYKRWRLFVLIFAVQALVLIFTYRFSGLNFNVSGLNDAFYYGSPMAFDENGVFSFQAWMTNMRWTHRGMISQAVSLIRNAVAGWLGIEAIYLFFIEISFLIAFVCAIVLPRFYHLLTGRQPYHLQALICWLLLNIYYGCYFYYTLTDVHAALFVLCGLCWFFSGFKKGRMRDLFIAGLMLSLAVNYRATYQTLIFITAAVLLLVPLANKLWAKLKKREEAVKEFRLAHFGKKCVYGLVVLLAGVLTAAAPQYIVTDLGTGTGHLFPYASVSARDNTNDYPRDQLAGNVYGAMSTYYFIHTPFQDAQMANFSQTVYTDKIYTMKDIIYCCMNRPMDFLNIYLKKFFYACSPEINEPYYIENLKDIKDFAVPLSRLLIFWIQGSLLYTVFKKRGRKRLYNKPTFWLSLLILLTSGAVGALLNLEWRYLMLMHLLMFFLMAFYIVEGYIEDNKTPQKRLFGVQYGAFMLLYCWGAMTADMTIITNFL